MPDTRHYKYSTVTACHCLSEIEKARDKVNISVLVKVLRMRYTRYTIIVA